MLPFAVAAALATLFCLARFREVEMGHESRLGLVELTCDGQAVPVAKKDAQLALDARCQDCVERIVRQLGTESAAISRPPFVVAGDGSASSLDEKYERLIEPTCEILNRQYFVTPPDAPITVLMFSGENIYRHFAERLFFDRNVSRFGYYKPGRRVVLANLAEGESAVRHELVHALMAFDFPHAPAWLQEGIATLYEDAYVCRIGGQLALKPVGNWRLSILQRDLRDGRSAHLRRLIELPSLRGPREAVYYAQARYLCFLLHERGRLEDVYCSVRDTPCEDPSGGVAVRRALGCTDWSSVDTAFGTWVLALSRP